MKKTSLESMVSLIKKHNLNVNLSLEALLDQLSAVGSEHSELVNSVNDLVTNKKYLKAASPAEFLTQCPDCGSHTLLNFSECHLCGSELLAGNDEAKEEVKVKAEVKEPKKEKVKKEEPKKEKARIVVEDDEFTEEVESPYKKKHTKDQVISPDEDDDFDLELDAAEAPKKEDKKTKKEEPKKAAKPVVEADDDFDFDDEPKPAKGTKAKAAVVVEEDLDLNFDDEVEEPKPAKGKKAAAKEEPKKEKVKKEEPKKETAKKADEELGELNDDFDISDFDDEDDTFADDADTDFDD